MAPAAPLVALRVTRELPEADSEEKLTGEREPFPAVSAPSPYDVEFYALGIRRRPPRNALGAQVGKVWHVARNRKERKGVFVREGNAVKLINQGDGTPSTFAVVLHLRRWLLLIPLLLACLLVCLSFSFCGSNPESPSLGFIEGQTQTQGAVSAPVASIDYAAYDATVDSTFKAGSMTQDFKLLLPATVTHGGETSGNPVASSPSVYVDLDGSGTFEESECVYNAPDATGYGKLLAAGSEVDSIELTQAIPAGQYKAMTLWRSVLSSDHSQAAGQSSFTFTLTVQ